MVNIINSGEEAKIIDDLARKNRELRRENELLKRQNDVLRKQAEIREEQIKIFKTEITDRISKLNEFVIFEED